MSHRKKLKKGIPPLDFYNGNKAEGENREKAFETSLPKIQKPLISEATAQPVSSLNGGTKNKNPQITVPSVPNSDEIKKMVEAAITQRLKEMNDATLSKRTLPKEKKYASKHIGVYQYPRLLSFRVDEKEPFPVTLDRVIEFAEKYRELNGGQKAH